MLASAELGEADEDKRPTVQVGDPFEESKLVECSLQLLEQGLIVALQDLGAAGITVPDEEKGRYQYCCFTDREGKASLLKSPAQPDMYTIQAEHFLACIRGEVACQSPGTQALKAVAVAEAECGLAANGEASQAGRPA